MSNTLNRLKDAIHPKPQEYGEPAGTHHSAAALRTTHAAPGVVGGTGAAPEAAYPSTSNYTAPARHHGHGPGTAAALPGPAPNTAGPHRHDILNKLDPSVDSKGAGQTVPGGIARPPQPVAGLPGPAATTGGPHHSNLMNKLDPNVDSRTGELKQGHAGAAPIANTHHHAGAGAATVGSDVPEGTYGPHKSRIANALDPRVDSDLDSNRTGTHGHVAPGAHSTTARYGHAGGAALPGPAPTTAGPHHSALMNKLDPSVDSRTGEVRGSGTRAAPATMHGAVAPGPAPNTAGPHRSDLLNKLDPAVDSKPHGGLRY